MNYDKGAIFNTMDQTFSNDDLDELCLHLNIDHEHLERTNKRTRIRDLINICERNNRLADLLFECQEMKPRADWNLITNSREQNRAFANEMGLSNLFEDARVETAFEVQVHRQVWQALDELKRSGEHLWQSASPQNIADFAYRLQTARSIVGINKALFQADHHSALMYLFKKMGDYRAGKERLLKIRSDRHEEELRWVADEGVRDKLQIELNKEFKQQYEDLLQMVAQDFKSGLAVALSPQI